MSNIPENLKYTKTHEWVLETDGTACIGITDNAQELLGDLVFVELPAIGKAIKAGETLGVLESVKAASDFYAPIDGVVSAINESLINNPALINSDPYNDGWLVKLTIDSGADLSHLLTAAGYNALITENN